MGEDRIRTRNRKKERLYRARDKQEKVKERIRESKLQKNIIEHLNKLPTREKNKIYTKEQRKRNLELAGKFLETQEQGEKV